MIKTTLPNGIEIELGKTIVHSIRKSTWSFEVVTGVPIVVFKDKITLEVRQSTRRTVPLDDIFTSSNRVISELEDYLSEQRRMAPLDAKIDINA